MAVSSTQELREQFELRAATSDLTIECAMAGSYLSQIAVVAEAPGASEVAQGSPLVGASGRYMWNAFKRFANLARNDCYVTNVCKRQVQFGTDVQKKAIGKHELTGWQELLRWELAQLPALKVVVAAGNYALQALLGEEGITKWRGSVVKTVIGEREVTIVCINNPAFCLRDERAGLAFNMDVQRKLKAVIDGTFIEHHINTLINPTAKEALAFIAAMRGEGKHVASDIETMQNETACIGFANNAHEAMCIPFRTIEGHAYTHEEERAIRLAVNGLYNDRRVKHVMQNGHFDCSWLLYKDRIHVQPIYFDTMLAHHTLYPTLPHNLGFLTAQYTTHPYYKDEKDDWRIVGGIDQYWRYNAKDCAITHAVATHELNELRNEHLDKFFFEHVMRLQHHLVMMTVCGIKIDTTLKERIRTDVAGEVERRLAAFYAAVQEATGDPQYTPNPKSPKQLSELYFSKLRLVGRGTSTDKDNRDVMFKHPRTNDAARKVIQAHNAFARENKFFTTYADSRADEDGRMRSSWSQIGVASAPGRLSSSQTLWGSGSNLQNQPNRAKEMFIADEGYSLVYFDMAQAEARIVGWKARIARWIEQFERARADGVYDAHRALAAEMFNVPYDEVPTFDHYDFSAGHPAPAGVEDFSPTIRYIAKRCRHGLNYRMAADRLATTTGLPFESSLDAYQKYHAASPEVRTWWHKTEVEVKTKRMLFNAYGRRYLQIEEPTPETMEAIIAFYPQSTLGDHVTRVIYKSQDDPQWPSHARIVLNLHDALIAVVRHDQAKRALRVMIKHAETAINIDGMQLIIPADAAISQPDHVGAHGPLKEGVHRWSTLKKLKRTELGQ